ncbi:MAG: hypothetical protein KHY08_03785 [Lachnospiraceae bacterium]|nr:hypothetical protein [Lachnospiraceae bacterium]
MKECVLIKKNVFTCVIFGAIFLFVLCESLYKSNTLSMIAFIITIPIFILSIIKLIVDILEDLNNKVTSFLSDIEKYKRLPGEKIYKIRNLREDEFNDVISDIYDRNSDNCWQGNELKRYYYAYKARGRIRSLRRGMLYIYYFVFMIILFLLFLHTELYTLLENNSWFTIINMDLFEVWSLIIILLEIMMKDMIEDSITYIIDKKLGIDLKYY